MREEMVAIILNQSHESCCCSDDEYYQRGQRVTQKQTKDRKLSMSIVELREGVKNE